jgi:hypothetical protein
LVRIVDEWAALQFDNAVTLVGLAIENAAQELHDVGGKMQRKYTMAQLLDQGFRLSSDDEIDSSTLRGVEGIAFDEVG